MVLISTVLADRQILNVLKASEYVTGFYNSSKPVRFTFYVGNSEARRRCHVTVLSYLTVRYCNSVTLPVLDTKPRSCVDDVHPYVSGYPVNLYPYLSLIAAALRTGVIITTAVGFLYIVASGTMQSSVFRSCRPVHHTGTPWAYGRVSMPLTRGKQYTL
jgi:hypothetical protein